MKISLRTILGLGFVIALFTQVLFTSQNITFAHNREIGDDVYAISNLGEKVDFKTLAPQFAKNKNLAEFTSRQIRPFIPGKAVSLYEQMGEQNVAPDSIIGTDDRVKVTDTTYFPLINRKLWLLR